MVSTQSMARERKSEAEQMALLMSLQREMAEMKRRNEETAQKNDDEILALRKENEEMRRKLGEGGSSVGPTNLVNRLFTDPKTVKEPNDRAHTQEVYGESYPNKFPPTTDTLDSVHRHPFINSIIGVPLPNKWKGFNRDRCDGMTNLDEHMDASTTHMSLYTSDDVVLCRVCPHIAEGRSPELVHETSFQLH